MFVVPCFIAILSGKRISDVLRPFETAAQAIAQCRAWTQKTTVLTEEDVPGFIYWAQYGGGADVVRVEQHVLELDDPQDDTANGAEPEGRLGMREPKSLARGANNLAEHEVDA